MRSQRDVLRSIFAKNNLLDEYRAQEPIFVWAEVSGELGKIARPRRVKGDTLVVDVPSAAAKQELSYLEKELLDRLNANLTERKLEKLQFQVGQFPDRSMGEEREYDISDVSLSDEELERIEDAVSDRGLDPDTEESLRDLLIAQQKNRKVRMADGWRECPNCGGIYDGRTCPYCGLPYVTS